MVVTAIAEIYVCMILHVCVYIHVPSGASEHGEKENARKGCIYKSCVSFHMSVGIPIHQGDVCVC